MENSFYGMTFYNETHAVDRNLTEVTQEETNLTAVKVAAAIFVTGMAIGTIVFCIRQRTLKKPAFDEI